MLGSIVAGAGTVTLHSTGAINEAGGITANTLSGSSTAGAFFDQFDNHVAKFGPFTNTGAINAGVVFFDADPVIIVGTVNSPTGLQLNGAKGLTLSGDLTAAAGISLLASGGSITQTAGIITAGSAKFTDFAVGGTIILPNANKISGAVEIGAFGAASLTNAAPLTISSAAGEPLTLTTVGAGSDLNLAGLVFNSTLGTITLNSAGKIIQTAGIISYDTLTGSSVGGASFAKKNLIKHLGSFSDTGSGSSGIAFTATGAFPFST
ncbi:MAG: hypothetical protein ACRD9W_26450, partial [Terriglobia bacterium]